MTAALRAAYARLVRRVSLAAGRGPCRIRIRVRGTPADTRMDVLGTAYWWATREDIAAELARVWRSARRQFAARRGRRLVLDEPIVLRLEGNRWT